MASESAEEGAVTVSLGPELEEWLDAQAAELGVDRETVLRGLVASSRAADVDGAADSDDLAAALADAQPVQAAVEDRVTAELDGLWADFQTKIEDVRERVIQVKKEADAKAAADHTHEELARVDAMGQRLTDVEAAVDDLEGTTADLREELATIDEDLAAVADADESATEDLAETVEQLQDRLKTVAWVVSDLREAHERRDGSAALDQLKQSAAAADVSRARCEQCGEGVEIGLLTEPRCPHCDATVTRVAPAEGFFGNPQLLVASQLESGEE